MAVVKPSSESLSHSDLLRRLGSIGSIACDLDLFDLFDLFHPMVSEPLSLISHLGKPRSRHVRQMLS